MKIFKRGFQPSKKKFLKNLKKYLTNNKMYDIMNKLLRNSENELNIENKIIKDNSHYSNLIT